MTAAPVMSITEELLAEMESYARTNCELRIDPVDVRAILDALKKDAGRLDWLVKEEARVIKLDNLDRFHVEWPNLDERQSLIFASPREAIDAARADNP